ncbi:MAG: hypothetical protein NT092_11965 [Bacteroidia bacterium]|nr:hypothetical protein [Bacteroidia bacterium]
MKKILPVLFLFVLFSQAAHGQTTESNGKPIAEIFTDFHVNINDTSKHTGFDLNRAYFGYHFIPGGKISGKVIINIGSPDDLASGAVPRRYAYIREASLIWSDEKLTVSAGITGTKIFEFQQRFWGKRYVANTYQSINGYGFIADLGVVVDYKFSDILKADLSVMNGEGYSNLQLDNNVRTSAGLTITPAQTIALRIYGDIQKMEGLWQPLFVAFAGFKNDLITIGGEISYKSNIDLVQGHHVWGISSTGGINLTEKMELFARYDYISSVVTGDDIEKWNHLKDGSFVIAGLQYVLSPNAKIALNYQGRYPYSPLDTGIDMIFLNALFKF